MESPASLGAVVRDRRLALGYSLGQLATKVNKTAASIRSWEKGDTHPGPAEVKALAAALDLDAGMLDDLLAEAPVSVPEPHAAVAVADPWPDGDKRRAGKGKKVPEPVVVAETVEAIEQSPEAELPAGPVAGSEPVADNVEADVSDFDSVAVIPVVHVAKPEPAAPAADPMADIAVYEPVADDVEADVPDFDSVAVIPVVHLAKPEPAAPAAELPAQIEGNPEDVAGGVIDDVVGGKEALEAARASLSNPAMNRPAPVATSTIHEAMTEAVPVVPAAVAVAEPSTLRGADLRGATAEPFPTTRSSNPAIYWWETAVAWYRRVFDPNRRWIYRLRFLLLVIVMLIMLRVLGWAVGELWDALQDVLDSISFSPSDTPDVTN